MKPSKFSFYERCERPWPNRRLKNAVIIGHTTATTAKLWARTAKEGKYLLCLVPINAEDNEKENRLNAIVDETHISLHEIQKSFPKCKHEILQTDFSKDCTATHEFKGLLPNQRYRYFLARMSEENSGQEWRVVIDAIPHGIVRNQEKGATKSVGLSFKTLNDDSKASFSFGLFSCHNPYVQSEDGDNVVDIENMSAWDSFGKALRRHSKGTEFKTGKQDLAFVIAGGDQCYVDGRPKIDIWQYLYKVMEKTADGKLLPEKEDMVSWYRDIYRAYWGFPQVRAAFGMYPTYMIWDDHEICDGWGSYEKPEAKGKSEKKRRHPIFSQIEENPKKNLNIKDGKKLLARMFEAACQVYDEYENSHNPQPYSNRRHYHFNHGNAHFFVMDGRGRRDINGNDNCKILGREQVDDFKKYVKNLKSASILFVVSAVPMVHTKSFVTKWGPIFSSGNADDLKDSWEHPMHEGEKQEIMDCLWAASKRGVRVCFLGGDVHASALFRIVNEDAKRVIYQITSSAITYHMPALMRLGAKVIAADDGEFDNVSEFERLAFFADSSYAMIRVSPDKRDVTVSFYDATKKVKVESPTKLNLADEQDGIAFQREIPVDHSLGKHLLAWEVK